MLYIYCWSITVLHCCVSFIVSEQWSQSALRIHTTVNCKTRGLGCALCENLKIIPLPQFVEKLSSTKLALMPKRLGTTPSYESKILRDWYFYYWASMVVQWRGIHLPIQETRVQSLGQEDPLSASGMKQTFLSNNLASGVLVFEKWATRPEFW